MERFRREVIKSLSELHTYILKVDLMGIMRVVNRVEEQVRILNGLKLEAEHKIESGNYTEQDITLSKLPTPIMQKSIDSIRTIVEIKYPEETIYGRKLDTKTLKQRDMLEWFVVLKQSMLDAIQVVIDSGKV